MDKFIIQGEVQLSGSVKISGAKNATLPIMAASLLCKGKTVLHNVPKLSDIEVMRKILSLLGVESIREGNSLTIDATLVNSEEIPEQLMREMRASIFLMGPLLGRFKTVKMFYPGGCAIGPRPINLHLKALQKLGANIQESYGYISIKTACLTGNEICLDFPSVGATENAMMAAILAKGITLIRNAAKEPEIVDLQNFLIAMGAKIKGAGTDIIQIEGVDKLYSCEYTIMPDRIEAGTFLIAGAITGGEIVVENVIPEHLSTLIDKLSDIGSEIHVGENYLRLKAKELRGVDIKTLPYPGFPTDLQAQMLSLLTLAKGTSIITETIFENRFKHSDEMARMGAKIKVEGRTAIIRGVAKLSGAIVDAPDLRAGVALVLAGLAAEGNTEINHIYHIDRGYENLENKLISLGAKLIRIEM